MSDQKSPVAIRRIIEATQQLIRVGTMPGGLFPFQDQQYLLGSVLGQLRDSIHKYKIKKGPGRLPEPHILELFVFGGQRTPRLGLEDSLDAFPSRSEHVESKRQVFCFRLLPLTTSGFHV
jgi:hypothetical protein